ncbi:MAG: hypothetical protein DID92_2727745389 [Candidatus Nitrotoga sp. SPKER]|nr:MAG: hypothetical protein DID92_2727745389 [Candidatus Nitrotoga sp. SPKER]
MIFTGNTIEDSWGKILHSKLSAIGLNTAQNWKTLSVTKTQANNADKAISHTEHKDQNTTR